MNIALLVFIVLLAGENAMGQGPPTRTRKGRRPASHLLAPALYAPPPAVLPRQPVPQTFLPIAAPPRQSATKLFLPAAAPPRQPVTAPFLSAVAPPRQSVLQGFLSAPMPAIQPALQAFLPAGLSQQPAPPTYMNYIPPAPTPVPTCKEKCPTYYAPVCGIFGTTYTNDCFSRCSGEAVQCNGACPCPAPPAQPPVLGGCSYCYVLFSADPVCVDDDETLFNECEALCKGKRVLCEKRCPCK